MKSLSDVKFSTLDLVPVRANGSPAQSLRNSLDLAQHVEKFGYNRFWVAEHHNMDGIASSATSVLLGYLAGGTSTIRVGSGGVMLPNHAPLVIAEQFGTLEALFPGRIDLGLCRAPGTDQLTARALRRGQSNSADTFPQDVVELQSYFQPAVPGQLLQAVPGAGLDVPIWLLGSSLFSAQVAAELGLPFAFASHFAPDHLAAALRLYRNEFHPSAALQRPYAMAAIAVYAAETDDAAKRLFTSLQQSFINLRKGNPMRLPPPVDDIEEHFSPIERAGVEHSFREAVVGSPATVQQ